MESHEAGPKVLRRSRDDRVIAGVCGGLGRYLGIDPVVVRLGALLLVVAAGSGVLLYLIAWLVIPEERPGENLGPPAAAHARSLRVVAGGALVLLGAVLLVRELTPSWFDDRYVWPVALILIGLLVLTRGERR